VEGDRAGGDDTFLEPTRDGHGGGLVLSGEAGMGKTAAILSRDSR
jgi:hypothetical protein